MPDQSTRFCKACGRALPLDAFSHKLVNFPKDHPRHGKDKIKRGRYPHCQECRARIAQRRAERLAVNPDGVCQCGCGQPVNPPERPTRRHRFLPGHHRYKSFNPYIVDPVTGCWNWQRATDRHGYGMTHLNGNAIAAHRAVYIEHKGNIPNGLILDHLCRNPLCVNPDHLEPVTYRENYLRGIRGKMTPDLIREIRSLAGTMTQAEIARRMGITAPYVSRIVNRRVWADLD